MRKSYVEEKLTKSAVLNSLVELFKFRPYCAHQSLVVKKGQKRDGQLMAFAWTYYGRTGQLHRQLGGTAVLRHRKVHILSEPANRQHETEGPCQDRRARPSVSKHLGILEQTPCPSAALAFVLFLPLSSTPRLPYGLGQISFLSASRSIVATTRAGCSRWISYR